jgi:HAE1 family hydrophobic/amphiphilic exporter-1
VPPDAPDPSLPPPESGASLDRDAAGAGAFLDGVVRRPVALLVVFATLIVIGVITYVRIPIQMLPEGFTSPQINLYVDHEGADAEENEQEIARVLEEQVRTLSGVENYESESEADGVFLSIDFDSAMDMDLAKAEVRDRIERARPLMPDTVERIFLWSEDGGSMPIGFFGILHPGDSARTDFLMDRVVIPRLEAVRGISKIDAWGVLQDSVRIELDEEKVVALNLNLGELIGRLTRDNFAEPLGDVQDGGTEVILRSDMRFKSLAEIEEYPIGNGLRVKDVGDVRRVKAVRDRLSRIDGSYAYFGVANKDSGSNVVETTDNLRAAMQELEADPRLGGEFKFIPFFMQGDMIKSSLSQLKDTALHGGLLAVVVLFVFLRRVRLTLCVACSIPASVLMAIAWQYFAGGSFNMLTMCGITLGIGMLVDNSVVVIENVARIKNQGVDALTAAALGTRQIALAVTLATLTTVVVFLPLIFMTAEPFLRVVFGAIGFPLCMSLLFSLLVAVVFLPVVAARLLGPRPAWVSRVVAATAPLTRLPARGVARAVGVVRGGLHAALGLLLRGNCLAARLLAPARHAIALAAAAVVAVAWLHRAPPIDVVPLLEPFGLAPASASEEALRGRLIELTLVALAVALLALFGLPRWRRRGALAPKLPAGLAPGGDSVLDLVVAGNRELVAWTLRHRLLATALAVAALSTLAVPTQMLDVGAFAEDAETDAARFEVTFEAPFTLEEAEGELRVYEDWLEAHRADLGFDHWSNHFDEREADLSIYYDTPLEPDALDAVQKRLKAELPQIPGHRLRFYDQEQSSERSSTVANVRITGPDSATLERLGWQAKKILEGVPGLKGVRTPRENAPDQLRVEIDRDAVHELGLDTEAVQQTIAYSLHGFTVSRYQEEGRDVPLLIEYDEDKVAGIASLKDLGVWSGTGTVPLASFTKMSYSKGASSINRRNGRTSFTLTAEVEDPLRVIAITETAHRALAELELPRGYEIDRSDSASARQQSESLELKKAFALGVVLVFLLMGILFESLLLPISVLFTIPFAVLGAMWTLLLTNTPLDSLGWIGLVILAGVVANNGIVLIDRIHRLHAAGVERSEAVVTGASQRVRPVLMTALTTVFGLIPMAMSQPASNALDYRSLATIVAGGLACSTFFTLWVIPLAYTVLDDLGGLLSARLRWWLRRPAPRRPAGGASPAAILDRLD